MENYNPYQAPESSLDNYDDDDYDIPPLYNPNAAALWSILFTPFGAWIHAKNWEAVGEDELAKQNYVFAIAMLATVIILTVLEMLTGIGLPIPHLALLLIWYFQFGKKQVTLFKEELGNDYEKASLVKPVLIGVVGGMIALVVVLMALEWVFGAMGLLHPKWLAE